MHDLGGALETRVEALRASGSYGKRPIGMHLADDHGVHPLFVEDRAEARVNQLRDAVREPRHGQ